MLVCRVVVATVVGQAAMCVWIPTTTLTPLTPACSALLAPVPSLPLWSESNLVLQKIMHLSNITIYLTLHILPLIPPPSTVCSADPAGNPVCSCRPGHEGQTCDSCSDGYFGQPPEFRCTRCDCNGNIDPDVPGSCDMSTGRCILCINNSTGDECEVCADGYFGNATLQDCQRKRVN